MTKRVLIAGGGIAGLAAARALHQQGILTSIFERATARVEEGLALNLPGNAIRALAALGLRDQISSLGSPVHRREYRSESGRLLFAVNEEEFWGSTFNSRCVRRKDLLRVLSDGVPDHAVRFGRAIDDVRQCSEQVEVNLTDSSLERGDLLIGADGVHSTVRRAIFGDQGTAAALLVAASFRFMASNPGVDCWTAWAGAQGICLLIPVDHDEVYGWAAVTRGAPVSPGAETLRSTFSRFPELVRKTLAEVWAKPACAYYSPLEEVRIPSWRRERVLLVGDAAHATAPVWAQGAALALEDALVLARLLARNDDWIQAAADYERERRERVLHVQRMTDRFSKAARLPMWMRHLITPFLGPRSYEATYKPLRYPV